MILTKDIILYKESGETIDHFTQWDSGQRIYIKDLSVPSDAEFHFSNIYSKNAIPVQASKEEDGISVAVPDSLLESSVPTIVHVYKKDTDGPSSTMYTVRIPVYPKKKPSDYHSDSRSEWFHRYDGSLVVDMQGYSYANVGFRPDVVVIRGEQHTVDGVYIECDLQTVFYESNIVKMTSALSPSGIESGFPYINAIVERTDSGFIIDRMWLSGLDGSESTCSGTGYYYTAIKYT